MFGHCPFWHSWSPCKGPIPSPSHATELCGSRPGSGACCALGKESPTSPFDSGWVVWDCTALGCFTYTSDPGPRRLQEHPGGVACHSNCDTCEAGSMTPLPRSLRRPGMPTWFSCFSVSCFAGSHSPFLVWQGQPHWSVPALLPVLVPWLHTAMQSRTDRVCVLQLNVVAG